METLKVLFKQKPYIDLQKRFSYLEFYKAPFKRAQQEFGQLAGQIRAMDIRYNEGMLNINQALNQLRMAYNQIIEYINALRLKQMEKAQEGSQILNKNAQQVGWQSVNQVLHNRTIRSATAGIGTHTIKELEEQQKQIQDQIVKNVDKVAEEKTKEAQVVKQTTTRRSSSHRRSSHRAYAYEPSSVSSVVKVVDKSTGETVGYEDRERGMSIQKNILTQAVYERQPVSESKPLSYEPTSTKGVTESHYERPVSESKPQMSVAPWSPLSLLGY